MAKYKVLKSFVDKDTKKHNKVDSVVELTDERAKEIASNGGNKYLKRVKETPKKKAKKESKEEGD